MAGDDAEARRSGRRGNGLGATAYVPLAELDPRLADAVLAALGEAGVAAYVTPSTGTTGGYLEVSLPDRPTDRVWVDSAARARAEAVLAELAGPSAPATPAVDEDESWRAIVATFQAAPPGTPTWPAAEEVADDGGALGGRTVRRAEPAQATGGLVDAGEDEHEHYVPPVPPPVPRPQGITRWAALALVVGLGVLILPAVLSDPVGPGVALLAVLAVIGGFATLVAQMRDAPPTDSGPDDGAVV